ncbi:hypothetical protein V5O48_006695 [Marasmius crinis-equi]|uniref:Uncharacterized protein n=1 Tax=Marasmius crinis-equi TaxID=585013 RepID=A0ABR3FFG5_9AGAR
MWSDVVVPLMRIQSVFVDDVGVPFMRKQAAFEEKFTLLYSVKEIANPLKAAGIQAALGDSIVFWRVWVLCAGDKKLVLAPFLLLIGTIACSFGFLGCFAQHNWPLVNPPTCDALIISAYSLSTATNLSVTIVIGYKLWFYRKHIGAYLGKCRQQARVERTLVLLLESGFIYSVIWVVQFIMMRMPSPPSLAGELVQYGLKAATLQLVGIYPTLLIVLIYFQRSMWDSSGNSTIVPCCKAFESNITGNTESGTT